MTLRETLEGLLKRARTPDRRAALEAELALPPFPLAVDYLWQAFLRLHSRRGSTGFGPARITWLDLDAFMRVTRLRLVPWEVEAIEACDDAFFRAQKPASEAEDEEVA